MRQFWLGSVLTTAAIALAAHAGHAADLKVVVTTKPVHALAAAVMAGVAEPKLLIDGAGSPHTFTLKPSDAKLVNEAQVLLRVSEGLEPFTIKMVAALPKSVRVVTLAGAPGLTLLPQREGGPFEAHEHGKAKGPAQKHSHDHAHAHGSGSTAKAADGIDGHLWLDPGNAKTMAVHMAEELAAVAPEHAQALRKNASELAQRIDQLDAELGEMLKPIAGKSYIVFHDAYQYLERRYGLTPAGSVTVNPDVPPSAKRLTELRRKIASLKAACVFAEPQFTPKVIDTIVEGTSARRGTLDPLGAGIPAGPGHYFAMMKAMASDLRACLANPA